jgi:hypothetical protein
MSTLHSSVAADHSFCSYFSVASMLFCVSSVFDLSILGANKFHCPAPLRSVSGVLR